LPPQATPQPSKPQDSLYNRYLAAKTKHKDAILFYRVGDFAEVMGENAKTVAKALDITLTGRNIDGQRIPMCGVPYHVVYNYITLLKQRGHKVAVHD